MALCETERLGCGLLGAFGVGTTTSMAPICKSCFNTPERSARRFVRPPPDQAGVPPGCLRTANTPPNSPVAVRSAGRSFLAWRAKATIRAAGIRSAETLKSYPPAAHPSALPRTSSTPAPTGDWHCRSCNCLLYTSDAADEEDSVDLGGRRIIKKKK